MSPGQCSADMECLANRCVPLGSDPVQPSTRRIVAAPSAIAVVSSRGTGGETLPAAVTFGGAAEGAAALYLRFAPVWHGAGAIQNAFVLLEPLPGTQIAPDDVEVEAWRVAGAWDPLRLAWLAQPRLAPPRARGIARASPPAPLRIEVTEIVRYWQKHARSERGLAIKSAAGDAFGASFATGAGGGAAPRLELYAR
jgi:hypothetical protein